MYIYGTFLAYDLKESTYNLGERLPLLDLNMLNHSEGSGVQTLLATALN